MRPAAIVGICLTCGILGFFLGARRHVEPATAPGSERIPLNVVTWDGGSVSVDDVRAALDQFGPQGKRRYEDETARREFVAELARTALFASEARRAGLDKNPEVVLRHRQELAAQFVKTYFEASQKSEPPEAELRQWYEAHRDTYSQPEAIRVAHLLVAASASDASLRTRRRKEAEALLAEVKKKGAADFYAFSNLAHAKSEDAATRGSGGELPLMSRQQLVERLGPAAEAAVAGLAPGEIVPKVLESERGYHLVRLLDIRAASEAPFAQVRESIAQQLRAERKAVAWRAFTAELEKATGFSIDESVVRDFKL